jgi:hypothetical protein
MDCVRRIQNARPLSDAEYVRARDDARTVVCPRRTRADGRGASVPAVDWVYEWLPGFLMRESERVRVVCFVILILPWLIFVVLRL